MAILIFGTWFYLRHWTDNLGIWGGPITIGGAEVIPLWSRFHPIHLTWETGLHTVTLTIGANRRQILKHMGGSFLMDRTGRQEAPRRTIRVTRFSPNPERFANRRRTNWEFTFDPEFPVETLDSFPLELQYEATEEWEGYLDISYVTQRDRRDSPRHATVKVTFKSRDLRNLRQ